MNKLKDISEVNALAICRRTLKMDTHLELRQMLCGSWIFGTFLFYFFSEKDKKHEKLQQKILFKLFSFTYNI